jgi:integrase
LTGCRKNEIASLQWSSVDLDRGYLRLPETKTGARTVHLGSHAVELLASLPRFAGSPFVFPATVGKGYFRGIDDAWRRHIRDRAGLAGVRIHDLRHSFASVGAAGGLSLRMIGELLGHQQVATTAKYSHLANDPVRAAADLIDDAIAGAMGEGRR